MADTDNNQHSFPGKNNGDQTVDAIFSTVETDSKTTVEEFSINGERLLNQLKSLIQQGNVRRIIVKTKDGKKLFELPLTAGIMGGTVGTLLFPVVSAIAVVGVIAIKLNIVIERANS